MNPPIKLLLLDIGGVLLTDGWETKSREEAAELFSLDTVDVNQRHRNSFDAYESGKITLDEYLDLVVFYEERSFSREEFKQFMMAQSKPYPDTIEYIAELKQQFQLPIATVNNEPLELNEYRINTFHLKKVIDVFVSSCYVNMRKPDPKMYQLALNMMQAKPEETLYIDDRKVYTEMAAKLGINAIHHTGLTSTQQQLAGFGLILPQKKTKHSTIKLL